MSQSDHHHHKMDSATRWKRKSLLNIERRKTMKKWLFRALVGVAVFMALAVVYVYSAT